MSACSIPRFQTSDAVILYQEGCVLYVSADTASVAEEIRKEWNLKPECRVEVSTQTDPAD